MSSNKKTTPTIISIPDKASILSHAHPIVLDIVYETLSGPLSKIFKGLIFNKDKHAVYVNEKELNLSLLVSVYLKLLDVRHFKKDPEYYRDDTNYITDDERGVSLNLFPVVYELSQYLLPTVFTVGDDIRVLDDEILESEGKYVVEEVDDIIARLSTFYQALQVYEQRVLEQLDEILK